MKIFKRVGNILKARYFMILSWLAFMLVTAFEFYKLDLLIHDRQEHFPEMLGYEVRLETALLVMVIAFYLMLSTIIRSIQNNKVKGCYYGLAILLIVAANPLIEKYYYMNSFFTDLKSYHVADWIFSIDFGMIWEPRGAFFNPSLFPFLISIGVLIMPLISTYLQALEEKEED